MQQFDKSVLIVIFGLFIFNTFSFPKTKTAITKPPALVEFKQWPSPPIFSLSPLKYYRAVIITTKGEIRVNLFAKEAPQTVNNFVFLARNGFYDGMRFYRVIKNFLVETGDPLETGRGGAGYRFADEPTKREFIRGALVMGNHGSNTNSGTIFIVHQNFDWPKQNTVFGAIPENDAQSFKTLDAIATLPVTRNGDGELSFPTADVLVTKISIEELQ